MMARVSVVIRSKNEAKLLRHCFQGIMEQHTDHTYEILLIDSGSTDETLSIAREFPEVRIHEIPPQSFNYGSALNLGVDLSQGDFIVFLSAHCVPINNQWLDALVAPLLSNDRLAGTFGRQVPWPDVSLHERRMLVETFPTESYVISEPIAKSRFEVVFSNASSCVRRDLIVDTAFEQLSFAEDRVWASDMLARGLQIAYVAESVVRHSHDWTLSGRYWIGFKMGQAYQEVGESAPYKYLGVVDALEISQTNMGVVV